MGFIADEAKSEVYGRPVGLAVLPDGSLLVVDDGGNVVWRVTYAGSGTTARADGGVWRPDRLVQVELETGVGLPDFVKDEFDAFLECGILAHGPLAPALRRLRP
jgi:hypothetical protein